MKEKVFYGIWNGKKNYWVHLSKNLGLFAAGDTGLRIVHGHLHNIGYNLGKNRAGADYQIRCLGEDGLPIGEPLNA